MEVRHVVSFPPHLFQCLLDSVHGTKGSLQLQGQAWTFHQLTSPP